MNKWTAELIKDPNKPLVKDLIIVYIWVFIFHRPVAEVERLKVHIVNNHYLIIICIRSDWLVEVLTKSQRFIFVDRKFRLRKKLCGCIRSEVIVTVCWLAGYRGSIPGGRPSHVWEKTRVWDRSPVGYSEPEWEDVAKRGSSCRKRGREGLSGGRCPVTDLSPPSTDPGPLRSVRTSSRTDTCWTFPSFSPTFLCCPLSYKVTCPTEPLLFFLFHPQFLFHFLFYLLLCSFPRFKPPGFVFLSLLKHALPQTDGHSLHRSTPVWLSW